MYGRLKGEVYHTTQKRERLSKPSKTKGTSECKGGVRRGKGGVSERWARDVSERVRNRAGKGWVGGGG